MGQLTEWVAELEKYSHPCDKREVKTEIARIEKELKVLNEE